MDGVTVELDKTRIIRFTNSALKQAEMIALKETGISITKLLQGQAMFYVIPLLVWAGLRREDPSLTRNMVETLIEGRLDEVGGLVATALDTAGLIGGNATRT